MTTENSPVSPVSSAASDDLKRLLLGNRLQMNELELDIFLEELSRKASSEIKIPQEQLAIDVELSGKNLDFVFTFKNPLLK
ncbi:MAG: hypothetical protein HQM10_03260 [Candidatus Riflebacteria bacterium]|nr:hypothetical protein [Candidatus Riflebacteria bacterium]